MHNAIILLNPEKERCSILFTFYFFFLWLMCSCRVGSLVDNISAALRAASMGSRESQRWLSCLSPSQLLLLEAEQWLCAGGILCCPGRSGKLQDVPWLGQGMWVRLVRRSLVSILPRVVLGNERRLWRSGKVDVCWITPTLGANQTLVLSVEPFSILFSFFPLFVKISMPLFKKENNLLVMRVSIAAYVSTALRGFLLVF